MDYIRIPPPPQKKKNENKQSTGSKRETQTILNETIKTKEFLDKSTLLKQAFPFAKFHAENL